MKKLLIIFTMMLAAMSAFSQKQERAYVRKANSLYKDSLYTQSEVLYRKALDMNSGSVEARYNLGNNLFASGKYDEALKEYEKASKLETDKAKLGQIYHNMGVAYQKQEKYAECIEAYKQALKNNPSDNDTKHNLTLALRMLQQQQQQQQHQQQNQDQNKDEQNKDKQQQNQNNNQNNKDEKKDQDKKEEQNPSDRQQQQQQKQDISKENAEQLLNSVMQDEKKVQDKVQKVMNAQSGRDLEKNW